MTASTCKPAVINTLAIYRVTDPDPDRLDGSSSSLLITSGMSFEGVAPTGGQYGYVGASASDLRCATQSTSLALIQSWIDIFRLPSRHTHGRNHQPGCCQYDGYHGQLSGVAYVIHLSRHLHPHWLRPKAVISFTFVSIRPMLSFHPERAHFNLFF